MQRKNPVRLRFLKVIIFFLIVGSGTALILKTFNDNILFFWAPNDIASKKVLPSKRLIRVGGLVKTGSLKQNSIDETYSFTITDSNNELSIIYKGILPNLFREGQSTIATGYLSRDGCFEATDLLAKHDEKYMPKEVAQILKDTKKITIDR